MQDYRLLTLPNTLATGANTKGLAANQPTTVINIVNANNQNPVQVTTAVPANM